jgi:hypothetical protein
MKLGEKNGWVYTATERGGDRLNVARTKRGKRVFVGVANSEDQARRMVKADMELRR